MVQSSDWNGFSRSRSAFVPERFSKTLLIPTDSLAQLPNVVIELDGAIRRNWYQILKNPSCQGNLDMLNTISCWTEYYPERKFSMKGGVIVHRSLNSREVKYLQSTNLARG